MLYKLARLSLMHATNWTSRKVKFGGRCNRMKWMLTNKNVELEQYFPLMNLTQFCGMHYNGWIASIEESICKCCRLGGCIVMDGFNQLHKMDNVNQWNKTQGMKSNIWWLNVTSLFVLETNGWVLWKMGGIVIQRMKLL